MGKLREPIQLIVNGEVDLLKRKYKDHALKGDLKGKRELHIEGDWLLIYEVKNNRLELWLLATGSHDELFRKQK